MSRYVDSFLKLRCAPDILGVVNPVQRETKEISEVYTVIRGLKKVVSSKETHNYKVLDLCAGNGLLGVTVAHLFDFKFVLAYDKRVPDRDWDRVRKYAYVERDIHTLSNMEGYVVLANHPCKLATEIVEKFCKYNAKALVLMPCCMGRIDVPRYLREKLGAYGAWCFQLTDIIRQYALKHKECIEINMWEDKNCLSPRNIVITAVRGYGC